jgi:hypothetical protein
MPEIKEHFYPGAQEFNSFGEGINDFLCVLCELPPSPKATVESLREIAFYAFPRPAFF